MMPTRAVVWTMSQEIEGHMYWKCHVTALSEIYNSNKGITFYQISFINIVLQTAQN